MGGLNGKFQVSRTNNKKPTCTFNPKLRLGTFATVCILGKNTFRFLLKYHERGMWLLDFSQLEITEYKSPVYRPSNSQGGRSQWPGDCVRVPPHSPSPSRTAACCRDTAGWPPSRTQVQSGAGWRTGGGSFPFLKQFFMDFYYNIIIFLS